MEYKFQAEVKQVLDIVVNSLYTDKEIFVRELVSNASDACEKERFALLSVKKDAPESSFKISISTDDKAGTFTIEDNGVGMNGSELVENLGTIAHSGSKAFLAALKKDKGDISAGLIGQFGVGFYSIFMVSDKVDVYTKSEKGKGLHWSCDGSENFTIEDCDKSDRGTKIVASLKPEFKEFSNGARIKDIVEKYSAYVDFPIAINGEDQKTRQAIWLKGKSEVTDEQYNDFYKFQFHSYDNPEDRLHFQADAPVELNALLYVPSENPERMGFGKTKGEVALYCKKVLIDPSPKHMFPEWMRFVKGVVDSADIPLNISRESMQDSSLVMKLGKMVLKRFLKHLAELSKKDPKKYSEIFKKFGIFFKEGATVDFENRDELTKLLRFESSLFPNGDLTSLDEYVSRMKDDQKEIYYACAFDRGAIESAPYIEAFRSRGLEVLYLYDPIDTFLMGNIGEYDKKPFASVDSAKVEMPNAPLDAPKDANPIPSENLDALKKWIKDTLGAEKVSDVVTGGRLVDSPAAALNDDSMTPQMRAMLKAMNPNSPLPPSIVKFEINPRSDVIKNIESLRGKDEPLAKLVLEQLFDNALLSAGLLENPRAMTKRLNEILSKVKPQ